MISIIIPTLNEEGCIQETLTYLIKQATQPIEIILADGGSTDSTVEIAAEFDAQIVNCTAGRSAQMNEGASVATGDILMFLHGDTRVPQGFDQMVMQTIATQPIAGAFNLKIAGKRWPLRWVEWGVKIRSHWFQLPYGDQAIFLKSSTFHEFGGFPELPIMEDFVFIRSLAKCGEIAIVPASVITSARRWEKQGVIKTTLLNQVMIIGYALGIAPDRLRQWYRSGGFWKI